MLLCLQGACPVRVNSVSYVIVTHFLQTRLRCKCKDKFKMYNYYRYSLYIRYLWWSSCSDLTNTVSSQSHTRGCGSATQLPRINVAPLPRPLVFRTMGRRRHRKLFYCYMFGRLYCSYVTKMMQLLYSAPAPYVHAHLMPQMTILNSHFLGGAKFRLNALF